MTVLADELRPVHVEAGFVFGTPKDRDEGPVEW
jgi:hypothetical protein